MSTMYLISFYCNLLPIIKSLVDARMPKMRQFSNQSSNMILVIPRPLSPESMRVIDHFNVLYRHFFNSLSLLSNECDNTSVVRSFHQQFVETFNRLFSAGVLIYNDFV